ncbi:MAG: Modification methylase HaeIII [Haliscomenobacter sp.]|jgi:DNA (cytosine-5)-methyltransferase 1|nr:Modification methylase HaeIII [Haliscomenobacter sp.]
MPFDYIKIPLLSFFTGGGFLDMGFERTGIFETIWTNECDPVFAKFYESGFSSWLKSSEKDAPVRSITNTNKVQDLTGDQIKREAFGAMIPDFFGIIGGPPCQDFSSMGKKNGFNGDRGKLTKEFLQKVKEIRPSFFVMENVAGLVHVKKTKKVFLEHLESLQQDYYLDHFILNALHYGTPQFRERVFVVGILKLWVNQADARFYFNEGWFPQPVKNYPDALSWKFPPQSLFGQIPEKEGDVPPELCVGYHLVPDKEMQNVPNANEYLKLHTSHEKLCKIKEGETNRQSFKRLHRFKYSPTVCYGNNEVHLHPYSQRRLSVREALRLQGVPDSYVLDSTGQLTKKFKMIGNGVPVPLAEAVAKAVLRFFETYKIIQKKENVGHLVEG